MVIQKTHDQACYIIKTFGKTIYFVWVLDHVGMKGNERADRAPEEGRRQENPREKEEKETVETLPTAACIKRKLKANLY